MAKNVTKLGETITNARESKGISQRQLAKLADMDSAEISRIENGKRQKPNVLFLKGIAEALNLSLVNLMEMAGYNDIDINWGRSKEENRSTEDLRQVIDEYKTFYFDILDDSYKKKEVVRKSRQRIYDIIERIDNPEFYKEKITLEDISKQLKEINEQLLPSAKKYDYNKLPKKD